MGNCIETCMHMHQVGFGGDEMKEKGGGSGANGSAEGDGGMKIKLVLTKKELELLSFQLVDKQGPALEDVLEEIRRFRCGSGMAAESWKPSLERIMETPEVPEMDR